MSRLSKVKMSSEGCRNLLLVVLFALFFLLRSQTNYFSLVFHSATSAKVMPEPTSPSTPHSGTWAHSKISNSQVTGASRRSLIVAGLVSISILIPVRASAQSIAQDYRTLEQIDSNKWTLVGDKKSKPVQRAISVIMEIRQRVADAKTELGEDPLVDISIDFAAPIPKRNGNFMADSKENPIISDVKAACEILRGSVNQESQADVDRISRLLGIAFRRIIKDRAFYVSPPGTSEWIASTQRRGDAENQRRLKALMDDYLQPSDKLLSFFA